MTRPMPASVTGRRGDILPFKVHRSFWGYVIRGSEGPPILLQVAQGLVLSLGAAFVVAAGLIAAAPAGGSDLSAMRFGLALILMALAVLLLRFATRGAVVELHIDLARGELREVVRHRVGRASTVGRHDFDPSASLHIDRRGPPGSPRSLVLYQRGNEQGHCIARGPEDALHDLRQRLELDLRLRGPRTPHDDDPDDALTA